MARWWFDAVKGGSSTFVNAEGEEQTVTLEPGQRFGRDDPCEMAAFLTAWNTTFVEEHPGVYASVMRACGDLVEALQAAEMAETIVVTAPGPASGGPPVVEDSPARQNAPAVQVSGELSVDPWPTPPRGGAPADLVFDPKHPLSPQEVVELVRPSLETPDASDKERMRRWLRNEPEPGEPRPTHAGETTRFPVTGGDPVELFQGTLMITQVDLDVPTAVLPLRLVRMYRSGRPYFGPWGFGWDHNYNVTLRELAGGGVAYWTGALHESVFRWTGEGFEPERGVHARLSRLPEGGSDGYLLTHPGGLALRFARPGGWTDAARIPLVEIRARHGNTQALAYNAENQLARVTDDDGRALVFDYGDCGLLEAVEDHTGRRVRYTHHPDIEHLVRVTVPPTASYPKGASTRYEYDDYARHPAMRHNLRFITDADGAAYLENRYGDDPSGWSFNRVVEQIYGGFQYLYEYEAIQFVPANPVYVDVPALRAMVRMPDRALHTYTFNYRGDLLDHRFRLSRDRSYRVVARQWSYDEQGNTTAAVDPDGGRTLFRYDAGNPDPCARGNLLEVERVAPPAFVAESRIVLRASYEPAYQLCREQVDERGSRTRFVYDHDTSPGPRATGRIARIELPDVTLVDGSVQRGAVVIETNARGQVTATVSPEGVRDETHYAGAGVSIGLPERLVRDAGGVAFEVQCEHDARGTLRRWIEPGGRVTEFHSDARGQLEEIVLPAVAGAVARMRWEYTGDGLVHRIERPRGAYADGVVKEDYLVEDLKRNALGHLVRATLGANTARPATWEFKVDSEGRTVREVDPVGLVTQRVFDERGLMLRERVTPARREELTTERAYDRSGRLVRVAAPDGRITRGEHDAWGRVARVTLPNGSEMVFVWGVVDRLTEIRLEGDPGDGGPRRVLSRQRFSHDERGRLVRAGVDVFDEDPAAAVVLATEYLYDGDDHVREVRGPRGAVARVACDGLGRVVVIEDPYGNVERTSYDDVRLTVTIAQEELGPDGVRLMTSLLEHDERGRLWCVTGPSGARVEIDHDDRDLPIERREPLGVVVQRRYDLAGELAAETVDPSGLAIASAYERDLLGRLVRYTDPTNEVTAWKRDFLGRTREMSLPDGSVWTRTWGSSGLTSATTPSGSTFTFGYDPGSGRVVSMRCLPGAGVDAVSPHAFKHDGLGRLVSAESAGQTVTRRYDSLDRMLAESAGGKGVSIAYDDLAGTQDLAFPDGRTERIETDVGGRPVRLSLVTPGLLGGSPGELATLSYAGENRLNAITYGNGVVTSFAYDDTLRPVRIEHAQGGLVLESWRARYDARNRRRVTQLLGPPASNRLYGFDTRDRLIEVRSGFALTPLGDVSSQAEHDADIASIEASGASVESYELDAADSRKSETRMPGAPRLTPFTYEAGHRLASAGAGALGHHPDGARARDAARTYDVDALGRVVRVRDVTTSTVLAAFVYDALSRSREVTLGGVTAARAFLGSTWIHEDGAEAIPLRQRSLHPTGLGTLAQISREGLAFPLVDGGLSAVCLTDGGGSVLERVRFEAFGAPAVLAPDGSAAPIEGISGVEPVFGGMPYLRDARLYFTPARLYDPAHGVFVARDPLLYQDSASPYVYARHDPVNLIDPDGRAVPLLISAGIGAVIGGVAGGVAAWANPHASVGDIAEGALVGAGGGFISGLTFGWAAGALTTAGFGAAASGALAGAASGGAGGFVSGGWYGGRRGHAESGGEINAAFRGALIGAGEEAAIGAVGGAVSGGLSGRVWSELVTRGSLPNGALRAIAAGGGAPYALLSPTSMIGTLALGVASATGGIAQLAIYEWLSHTRGEPGPSETDWKQASALSFAGGIGGALAQRYAPGAPMQEYARRYNAGRTPSGARVAYGLTEELVKENYFRTERFKATRRYRATFDIDGAEFAAIHHDRAVAGYPELHDNFDILRPVASREAHAQMHEKFRTPTSGPSAMNIITHGPSTPRFPGSPGLPSGTSGWRPKK